MRSKSQISLNYSYKVNFKDFLYQTLCVLPQIKDRTHIELNFHSVVGIMPQWWDLGMLGVGGVKNFSVGICDGAPSTARSSLYLFISIFLFI